MSAITIPTQIKPATRQLSIKADSLNIDVESRIIEFSFSSTRPVERIDWDQWEIFDEVLSHDPKNIRLERVNNGVCPFLMAHMPFSQAGVIQKVWFEGDRGYAQAKLSRRQEIDDYLSDLADNIRTGVSFGYRIYEYLIQKKPQDKKEKSVYLATDWELLEISGDVAIPADPSIGIGRSLNSEPNKVIIRGLENTFINQEKMADDKNETLELRLELERTKTNLGTLTATVQERDALVTELRGQVAQLSDRIQLLQKAADQVPELERAIAEKDALINTMDREQKVTNNYNNLVRQAEALVQEAKLSGAEFNNLFGADPKVKMAELLKSNTCEMHLSNIEFYLENASKRSPIVPTQLKTANEPIAQPEGRTETPEEIRKAAQRLVNNRRNRRVFIG